MIKSFLVGLGFTVDDASLGKFNQAIKTATLRVTALYATIKAASSAIVYGISEISAGFEKMGYEYHIIAPAINKALVLRRELLRAYSAAGINITRVIQQSVNLNMSLAKTRFAFEAIYKSVASRFFSTLTQQSDQLRKKIYANMPKILNALETFVKFVFKAAHAANQLGARLFSILSRVYDFFVKLHDKTHGISTGILAFAAAWELLNLQFIATPLGMIITGLFAILALFDDFKTWEEGGKSLFNWSYAVPVINSVIQVMKSLWRILTDIADAISSVIFGFYQLFTGNLKGAISEFTNFLRANLNALKDLWGVLKGNFDIFSSLSTFAPHAFGGAPLGSGGAASGTTNQNVHQQTNINVIGAADAAGTANLVSGQQQRVNFDLTRNMRGATR